MAFFSSTVEAFWKGMLCAGFAAIEQQFTTSFACGRQWAGEESWACWECFFSMGQQLWREGEGSGLGAGEVPAGTTTAARDWWPEHVITRWLTDHARSVTIRTTPVDRLLAIAVTSLRSAIFSCCDWHHMGRK